MPAAPSPTDDASISAALLLAGCLRLGSPQAQAARLADLTAAQWPAVLEQANRLRVEALLYAALHRLPQPPPALDPAALDALRKVYLAGLGRNLKLYHQLNRLLAAFQQAGIPVILLKGAHLAKAIYADIGLRPMTDLDLLTPAPRLGECARMLEGMGYRCDRAYRLESELRRHHHLPPYRLNETTVELHAALVSPLSPWEVDLDGLWQRAQPPAALPGALGLAPEDLLLYLSLHLLQDEFALGFKRIYDIALALEHFGEALDGAALQRRAAAWGLTKGLFLALFLARELFDAPVSAGLLQTLQPADFSAEIAAMARRRVLTVRPPKAEVHPGVARILRRQPLRHKLRRLRMVLFSYPELIADEYGLPEGSKIVYLYYPLRWGAMLIEFVRQGLRLARGEQAAQEEARMENLLSDWYMAP